MKCPHKFMCSVWSAQIIILFWVIVGKFRRLGPAWWRCSLETHLWELFRAEAHSCYCSSLFLIPWRELLSHILLTMKDNNFWNHKQNAFFLSCFFQNLVTEEKKTNRKFLERSRTKPGHVVESSQLVRKYWKRFKGQIHCCKRIVMGYCERSSESH